MFSCFWKQLDDVDASVNGTFAWTSTLPVFFMISSYRAQAFDVESRIRMFDEFWKATVRRLGTLANSLHVTSLADKFWGRVRTIRLAFLYHSIAFTNSTWEASLHSYSS